MKKLAYILTFFLVGGFGLQAQSIDVQLVESADGCENGMYCADLQIKGEALNNGSLGNSSIRFNYDKNVLSFFGTNTGVTTGSYTSKSFDQAFSCNAFGTDVQPYKAHSFDGTVEGDFLITLLLENWIDQYECATIEADWVSLSTICFEVIDASADPKLEIRGTQNGVVADLSGTNFNPTSNNPSEKYGNGELRALNASMDDICDGITSGIESTNGNFSWSIESIAPMPVQSTLFIKLNLDETSDITTQIFDLNGKLIKEQNSKVVAGANQVELDVRDIASGAYLISISKGGEVIAEKIIKE